MEKTHKSEPKTRRGRLALLRRLMDEQTDKKAGAFLVKQQLNYWCFSRTTRDDYLEQLGID